MNLSLNWLKEYVNIPKSVTPEELGLRLTMHTVEIDSVEKQGEKYENIVVGEILEVKKHPNADKLQLAVVNVGSRLAGRDGKLGIVCGAPNIEAGQKVPVAMVGAKLPNGLEIKETEIRGEKSCGMLCAEDELGLGEDHSGIVIFDAKAKVGQKLADHLLLNDVVFEVDNKSITNRPDLWGHYGMTREIAAFLGCKLNKYNANLANSPRIDKLSNGVNANLANCESTKTPPHPKGHPSEEGINIDVKVEDVELCPRYMAIAMDGIKIEDSPRWMQDRLIAVGVRPISNIVDITNYVMFELGQPMHAFDYKQIATDKNTDSYRCKIGIRTAKKGEIIITLDGEKRELDEEMLLITDGKDPMAIAGVMGGENSEINNDTTTIVYEAANFNFASIRKTSGKLGLRSESSVRFEKSLDPNLCEIALARAVELTKKICPKAKAVSPVADINNYKLNSDPIELDIDWLNKFIGFKFPENKVKTILLSLGFIVDETRKNVFKIGVPSWRATKDISIKEDIAEEVARIYGYDNFTPLMPKVEMRAPDRDEERAVIKKIKNILSGGAGLSEVYNYSFVGEKQLKKIGLDYSANIKLANPISNDMTLLRRSLAPNLFLNIKTNQVRYDHYKIFEIGSVYLNIEGSLEKDDKGSGKLPFQEKRLGLAAANDKQDIFSELKGVIEYLFLRLGLCCTFDLSENIPGWGDNRFSAEIKYGQSVLGTISKINKESAKKFGIKKEAVIAEISLGEVFKYTGSSRDIKYQPAAKYPSAHRDIAFIVAEKVLYNDIKEEIYKLNDYIKKVELFDVYRGEKLGKNKKNLAFHLVYQADKTLTSEEVDAIQTKLIKKLEARFEAKVRDF